MKTPTATVFIRHFRFARTILSVLAVMAAASIILTMSGYSTALPTGLTSVSTFEVKRNLGKWYEIARLDHSFERGLSDVSATYTLKPDGSLEVINRGFDTKKNEWKSAAERALFTGSQNQGSPKVSFFGLFFGGYHVLALDQTGYQWIHAHNKALSSTIRDQLASQVKKMGFATENRLLVGYTRADN